MNKKTARIGDIVIDNHNREFKVIYVRRARDILLTMDDAEAFEFGEQKKSIYGKNWLKDYFEVGIKVNDGVKWIEANKIKSN
jgi:hypothetical protein